MKKAILILLLVVVVIAVIRPMIWTNPCAPLLYPRAAKIIGVEYDNDLYIIEDGAGLIWTWKGVTDLSCGDDIAMLMWNHMTPWTIYDDVIIDIG